VPLEVERLLLRRGAQLLIHGTLRVVDAVGPVADVLHESERHMRLVVDGALDAVITMDSSGAITGWNPQAEAIFGWSRAEVLGRDLGETIVPPAQRAAHAAGFRRFLATGQGPMVNRHVETVALRRNGEPFPVELAIVPLIEAGHPYAVSAFLRDITGRKRAEAELRLAASVFNNGIQAIVIADAAGRILRVNAAFSRITGYPAAEVLGRNPRLLQSGRQDAAFYARMWAQLAHDGHWEGEIWNRRRSGEVYPEWLSISAVRDERGTLTHYIGVFDDITDKKSAEARIERLAHYDPLTGLPNRHLFFDRLERALTLAHRERRAVALLYADLDGFKEINDSLGHSAGDRLLSEVAQRLQGCLRETDTVARIGGDEFTLLLPSLADERAAQDSAAQVATKVVRALAAPFEFLGVAASISASVGVAVYPRHGADGDELLHQADEAMYRAKSRGKNAWEMAGAGPGRGWRLGVG
jgi:diguanylate cyclase (GGDEF)-like protein/PAS domain S-box-containing protein